MYEQVDEQRTKEIREAKLLHGISLEMRRAIRRYDVMNAAQLAAVRTKGRTVAEGGSDDIALGLGLLATLAAADGVQKRDTWRKTSNVPGVL